ncbi:MAG: NAD(+)/NADH kinase [Lachnospiraceae bacterium]|nr:NAD(+)/NADH kinase [Lachnospiraceae bacterium]
MKKFYIISNELKDRDCVITNRIAKLLNEHAIQYDIHRIMFQNDHCEEHLMCSHHVERDTDCIIVIGGDGTLIQAARDLADVDVPMIGVNLGHLGYLAEIEKDNLEEMILMIIEGKYKIESRIMLRGSVYRNGQTIYSDIALNDIVCARSGAIRMLDLKVYVNEEYLKLYSADGVIISTPTGSTAYNLSAGGPILQPGADIMVITPICSHTLGARSIVLSANSKIDIEICDDRHIEDNGTGVYFDGQLYPLLPGDFIKIEKSEQQTKIMKLNRMSFVEVLHNKMN